MLATAACISVPAQEMLPYQNANLTPEERAEDLIGRLTLEEKTKLMMDTSPAIPRLGIPPFQWWNEALHGIGRNGFSTVFPITMGMAASFDDLLLYNVFTAVSDEARAKAQQAKQTGNIKRYQSLSFWTPNINIFRDPRWGRGQETYGEDPYLTSKMGMAVVNGLQGQGYDGSPSDTKYVKLLACAKHFAVHSGPEWNRHNFNIEQLPERDLWETYLPAFKALVQDTHVAEVMCAYQRIDGAPCCSNARYERHILRDQWGFQGLITSDCGAINDFYVPGRHGTAQNEAEATAQAINAGTDVECGSVYRHLPEAVRQGLISEEKVNTSLKRLLTARFRLGDFDRDEDVSWTHTPASCIASPEHKQLALKMAQESMVLLQNKNGILPLSKEADFVVMGPNATDSMMQRGNYAGYPTATTTILQGIRQLTGRDVKYIPACTLTRNQVTESRMAQFAQPDGSKGMKATYWNNTRMEGTPAATQLISTTVNLSNGGNTVFAPGVNLERFSARYEGILTPQEDETLQLHLACDDGYRIIIDGDTIESKWRAEEHVQTTTKSLKMQKGKPVSIQIDYLQNNDYAMMSLDISKTYTPTREQLLQQVGDAETVIFVGGISPSLEGEEMKVSEPGFKGGDRTDIELPAAQREVIAMLKQAGKRVVYVNCSGSAVALVPETGNAEAILQAWYPGERGGEAVAQVLFGEVNPSGKLPVTFYRSVDDLPDFLDYTMKNRTYRYFKGEALFPFGHGLSYTTFAYGKPKYKKGKVSFTLYNKGTREGTEAAQVYIKRLADTEGPTKSLRAYKRVTLKAGEQQNVSIDLPRESFEVWDAETNTMRVIPGKYQLFVGGSSADCQDTILTVK